MPTQRRPREQSPSPLLVRYAEEIVRSADGPIVDVGCGHGRNAIFIASFGVSVVCLDNDPVALRHIDSDARGSIAGLLKTQMIDLEKAPWPYEPETVGAIISVHAPFQQLVHQFALSLKTRAYLLLESVGGHGGNYLSLPEPGFLKAALEPAFEFRFFKESRVGPSGSNAVTTKLVAQKFK